MNNAPNITSLVKLKESWYKENITQFFNDYYKNIFDLRTANDFGLAVWSIILDVPLYDSREMISGSRIFGFGPNYHNFNNGNFGRERSASGTLTAEDRRFILRLRYFNLTCRGNASEINEFLYKLYGEGEVTLIDNLNMTMTYSFRTTPPAYLLETIRQFDILPRPSGVKIIIEVRRS